MKDSAYVVATLREQSIFIITMSSFGDIARDCRHCELMTMVGELLSVVEFRGESISFR